jgi:hypothetical protein
MSDSEEPPKIIVDEDWKAQVEREKEALKGEAHPEQSQKSKTSQDGQIPAPPPASWESLVSMLASQAMAALGLLPDPVTGEATPNRPLAKFLIDTLGVLENKTAGNRTEEETAHLIEALHHLRMIYVSSPVNPDTEPSSPKEHLRSAIIELP